MSAPRDQPEPQNTPRNRNLDELVAAKKPEAPKNPVPLKKAEDAVSVMPASQAVSFVEFRPDAVTRAGFPMAQLCHYTLEPNPDAGDQPDAPRERLTLAFSTADVVLVGLRLAALLEPLQQHRLASVVAHDARYAHAGAPQPWVARITIGPPGKI